MSQAPSDNASEGQRPSDSENSTEKTNDTTVQQKSDADKPPAQAFLGDLTDGREKGNWKTRYSLDAQPKIKWEKEYLIWVLALCLVLPLLIGISSKIFLTDFDPTKNFLNTRKYLFAWFGGTLGGTLYSIKWLVHSVAKNTWNEDRRLWRIFTPFLSGSLALIIILLINSEMFKVSTPDNINIHKCYGIGFLVGYFSDNAIGKLTEIAQVFFGSSMSQRK